MNKKMLQKIKTEVFFSLALLYIYVVLILVLVIPHAVSKWP